MKHRYQAYYCEENSWWLCHQGVGQGPRYAVFISNPARQCLMWHQRPGGARGWVVWDYHVMVMARENAGWQAWDLDTTLGLPCPAGDYLRQTFREALARPQLLATFRVVEAERFVKVFSSDRSHMRNASGEWQQPPPPWNPLGEGRPSNLMRFIDMEAPFEGEVLDYPAMVARFGQ